MDRDKRNFFKRPQDNQFKRIRIKKKGRESHIRHEESPGISSSGDTVYRILCPLRKIGGVIGKGGTKIRALREETQAKITVADSVHGSDERVIIIISSPKKNSSRENKDDGAAVQNEEDCMEPHCAAQLALLKVHDRIVVDDSSGGMASDSDNENSVVIARLLVPNNMVGCLLGKGGDVIQRLRSETGASIRVLPADHLPSCAMSTDELVQISGTPVVARKALYQVSTLLHQNPRKDNPVNFRMTYGGQNIYPSGGPMMNVSPPHNAMWPNRNPTSNKMQHMPWSEEYGNEPPALSGENRAEFSMKILCSVGKIGGVIGKGGSNVRLLQQETGASIHVEDASADSDERVIRVSAFEALWNTRSETIEAILHLQNKTSEVSDTGTITIRLLVSSSKVGCILGQGGQVINEMRRRTRADIRVCSKDDKPMCASEDEELVQISGNFSVVNDALAEIASRLRVRTLRDASSKTDAGPLGQVQGFGPARSLPGRGPPPSGFVGATRSVGYELQMGGGHEYETQSYPGPQAASRYPAADGAMEVKMPSNGFDSVMRTGGARIPGTREVTGMRMLHDPPYDNREYGVDVRKASHNNFQAYMASTGPNTSAHHDHCRGGINAQQSPYQNMNSQQMAYQSMNVQQSPYQNVNSQQMAYESMNVQQSLHSGTALPGLYANVNASEGSYYSMQAEHSNYHY